MSESLNKINHLLKEHKKSTRNRSNFGKKSKTEYLTIKPSLIIIFIYCLYDTEQRCSVMSGGAFVPFKASADAFFILIHAINKEDRQCILMMR